MFSYELMDFCIGTIDIFFKLYFVFSYIIIIAYEYLNTFKKKIL